MKTENGGGDLSLDRRRFLHAAVAAATLSSAGVLGLHLGCAGREDEWVAEIRNALAGFDVGDEVLTRFVLDHRRYSDGNTHAAIGHRPEIAGLFLLSTDFFQHAARRDRALSYVRYFDPYLAPCYHPMPQRVPEASAQNSE